MRLTKPVAEFGRQLTGYSLQQPFAVCRSLVPLLLLHDDSPPNQPVRERHRGIDVANDTPPRKDDDVPYVANAVPCHRHRCRDFCQLCLLTFHNIRRILYYNLRHVAADAVRTYVAADRFRLGPRAKRRGERRQQRQIAHGSAGRPCRLRRFLGHFVVPCKLVCFACGGRDGARPSRWSRGDRPTFLQFQQIAARLFVWPFILGAGRQGKGIQRDTSEGQATGMLSENRDERVVSARNSLSASDIIRQAYPF